MTAELKKDGINIKDAAEILGVPRSRFYPRNRKSNKTPKPKQNYVSDKELSVAIKMACNRYPLYGYRRIRVILRREFNINVSQKRVNRVMNKLDLRHDQDLSQRLALYYGNN